MPTATYDLIASNVLSSDTATISFSSIPATYRDLVLVVTGARTTTTGFPSLRFNSDGSNSYALILMRGTGSTATQNATAGTTEGDFYFDGWTTGVIGTSQALVVFNIMDYSATDKHKTVLQRFNRADGTVNAQAGRWAKTEAITSIDINGNTWASGASFYLYGIVS